MTTFNCLRLTMDDFNVFEVVTNFIKCEYSDIVVESRNKFLGCKFARTNRFYILYVSYLYGKLVLTYRKNINEEDVVRERLDENDIDSILKLITYVLNTAILNKPIAISSKNELRIRNKNKRIYNRYIDVFENIKLYELNLQPSFYQYLSELGINSLFDFLVYDFSFINDKEFLFNRIMNLKNFLTSESNYSILNYKYLLKSSFKDKFGVKDYEKYIDFGLCVGNSFLISNYFDERNINIFSDYMNLVSKSHFTFRDLGEKYNVSFGRVRDIINKMVKKLKFHKGEYVLLFNNVKEDDVLNYFAIGIVGLYNRSFLKMILDILDLDIYDSIYYRIKFFLDNIKSVQYVKVNENKLYNLIKFPLNVKKSNTLFFRTLCKMRTVDKGSSFSGKIKLEKSHDFIQYESLTEKRIIEMFNSCDFVKYIKTQSLVIPFRNFKHDFEYYPDIQILTIDNKLVIIEVKPLIYMMEKSSIFKFNLLKDYALKNNYAYAFMDDNYNSFDDVLERKVSQEIARSFLDFLKEVRVIDYKLFKEFKKKSKCQLIDIVNIVIKNNECIEFTVKPFKFVYKEKKKPI